MWYAGRLHRVATQVEGGEGRNSEKRAGGGGGGVEGTRILERYVLSATMNTVALKYW